MQKELLLAVQGKAPITMGVRPSQAIPDIPRVCTTPVSMHTIPLNIRGFTAVTRTI